MIENYKKANTLFMQYSQSRGWDEKVTSDRIRVFLAEHTITVDVFEGMNGVYKGMCKDKKGKKRWHGSLETTDYGTAKQKILDIAFGYLEERN